MKIHKNFYLLLFVFFSLCITQAFAGVEGVITGTVTDNNGIAVANAAVQLSSPEGRSVKNVTTTATGAFQIFPVDFGDYTLHVNMQGFAPYVAEVKVSSGNTSNLDIQLSPAGSNEMELKVRVKKHLIDEGVSQSINTETKEDIDKLPQGSSISLPNLMTETNPGMVLGSFGQVFVRGNHANIQYQIDGVQLPDSLTGAFGDAFSPGNIESVEFITGGIPAEFGNRLASVVDIITKSGTESPGGSFEMNYGSFNRISPQLFYGGSDPSGSLHYFLSANYNTTDRGLDTPEPASDSNQAQGGSQVVHDYSNGNNEFLKLDWIADNDNKFMLNLFNSEQFYQIPNFPASFNPTDPLFNSPDEFGNDPYNYAPAGTNDTQSNSDIYAQIGWTHTFSESSYFQLVPYWKFSHVQFNNDLTNDLASATLITGDTPSSLYMDRQADNYGIKGDYTARPDGQNLFKAGFQVQYSISGGPVTVYGFDPSGNSVTSSDNGTDIGYTESGYVQDDYTIAKWLILNAGLRFDATQFIFSGVTPDDYEFQPRLGLNFLPTDTTKLHIYYGKLFQPAPIEDLRDTFAVFTGNLQPYDIKAEKDDYYEIGVAQQIGDNQVVSVNGYYKNAVNMLDDVQLLNTAVSQPYNFAVGYAYGLEFTIKGEITKELSDFVNYSYEIAKGSGLSGGLFAFPPAPADNTYYYLDHVQIHTANMGLTYSNDNFWITGEGLYGSGLRTGDNNSISLPAHFTANATIGYDFKDKNGNSDWKISADFINIFNDPYAITVANGFNGSHYDPGFVYELHIVKGF